MQGFSGWDLAIARSAATWHNVAVTMQ